MKALGNTMYCKKEEMSSSLEYELCQRSKKLAETITHEELVNIIREAKNQVAMRIFLYGIVIAFILGGTVISLLTNKIDLLLFAPIGLTLFVAFITALYSSNNWENPRSILENLTVFYTKQQMKNWLKDNLDVLNELQSMVEHQKSSLAHPVLSKFVAFLPKDLSEPKTLSKIMWLHKVEQTFIKNQKTTQNCAKEQNDLKAFIKTIGVKKQL